MAGATGYIVEFENNEPVRAAPGIVCDISEFVRFANDNDRTVIQSLFVEAHTESDAVAIAAKVAKAIWGEMLRMRNECAAYHPVRTDR